MERPEYKNATVFMLVALFWGANWFVVKIGLGSAPPFWLATARFVVSYLALGLIILFKKPDFSPAWSNIGKILFSGVFSYALSYSFVYWGQGHVSSGLAAILFATVTFFVAIFAVWMLPNERMTLQKLSGILSGFAGLVVIYYTDISLQGEGAAFGSFLIILGASSAGFATVYVRRYLRDIDPLVLTHTQMISGFFVLLVLALAFEDYGSIEFDSGMILPTIYNSVFGTAFAFWGFFFLLSRLEAVRASLVGFVTPVVALFLGWIFLEETITLRFVIGAALVLLGIYLAMRPKPVAQKL